MCVSADCSVLAFVEQLCASDMSRGAWVSVAGFFFLVSKRAPSYIYVKQITSKHCYSLFIEHDVIVLRGLEIEKPETEKVATHQ